MAELEVAGLVSSPRSIDRAALAALAGQISDVGALVAGRAGAGVRLQELLVAAGVLGSATYATLESTDGAFSASVPVDEIRDGVVVHSHDGSDLPAEFGGPFRLLIPDAARCETGGADNCATVKFLGRITLESEAGRDTRTVR